jgi:tetratricopeptide (TPR) repeat protein
MARRALLAAAVALLLCGCGIVEEDGAFLSEYGAREIMGSARTLERRGETVRAAEIYEALALGFPTQYYAERSLESAARCREDAARRATGPERDAQAERALDLWRRLLERDPGAQRGVWARYRVAALLAGVLGGDARCGEALAPLEGAAGDPALPAQERARARWLRARCLLDLGRAEEAAREAAPLLDADNGWTEEGSGVPLRVKARGLVEGQEGFGEPEAPGVPGVPAVPGAGGTHSS